MSHGIEVMAALIATLTSTEAGTPAIVPTATVATTQILTDPPRPESNALLDKIKIELGGELFVRARARKQAGASFEKSYALNRARLSFTVRYEDLLRLTLEPDFAASLCQAGGAVCDDAELSDAFAELSPNDMFDARIGQAKTPYGILETTSAWELPAQRRGMVSDLVSDRLRFGGRKLGIKTRARLKDLPLKPSIELGAYTDTARSDDEDFAARVTVKPWKGGEVQLQGYVEREATTHRKSAFAGALAILHDRGAIFAAAELQVGRGRLLTMFGDVGMDATFLAARVLAAYAIAFDKDKTFELAPFFGIDVFDPSTLTKDDAGLELRGGVNFYLLRMFRVSAQVDRRIAARAFPTPEATVISFLLGAALP